MSVDFDSICVNRDTVMTLIAIIDPEGAQARKGARLKRRVYVNKVD